MKKWRWMNDMALVEDAGNRPAVLCAGRTSREDDTPALKQSHEGRLVPFSARTPAGYLIEAAPDLLDACERLMRLPAVLTIRDSYDPGEPERAAIDAAIEAIHKAGGR